MTKLRQLSKLCRLLPGLLLAALLGCAGAGRQALAPRAAVMASGMGRTAQLGSAQFTALETRLLQQSAPAGVDPGEWSSLRATLLDVLRTRVAQRLPDQGRNFVNDIAFTDDGAGGWDMTWTYRNIGDYNLDGEVSITDLTPLGINLGETSGSASWSFAQAADGDSNGEVNVSDLTPIGVNILSQIRGYNIYGSASETGPWTLVDGVPLSSATAGFPRGFNYPLGVAAYAWYTVSPYDATGADWISGGGTADPVQVYGDFNDAAKDITQKTYDYIKTYNSTVSANVDAMDPNQLNAHIQAYLDAGQAWLDSAANLDQCNAALNDLHAGTSSLRQASDGLCDYIPGTEGGAGPGTMQDVGNMVQEATTKMEQLKQQYPEWNVPGSDDWVSYQNEAAKLPKQMISKGSGIVGGGVAGAFGGIIGGGLGTVAVELGYFAGFSKLMVVGAAGAAGGAIAGVAFGIYYVYSTRKKGGSEVAADSDFFWAASVGNNEAFPICMPPGGTLVITAPGYAPFIFDNFDPGAAEQISFDLTFAEDDTPNPLSVIQCERTDGPAIGLDCSAIVGVNATTVPQDPGPGQAVTVTATVLPKVAGCSVSYSVAGTDGYSASGSPASDANGQITFTIPGGAAGVHDSVSITANGRSFSVAYTF